MALLTENYDPAIAYGANISTKDNPLVDSSANEYVKFSKATTAVNEITVGNAAASSNPSVTASGNDTNISLQLSPKGTGIVLVGDSSTGTVASGSVTINAQRGQVTIGGLNVTAGTVTTFDLVNNKITTSSQIQATIAGNNTITAGIPILGRIQIAVAGSATIQIANLTGGGTLAGTAVVSFAVLN